MQLVQRERRVDQENSRWFLRRNDKGHHRLHSMLSLRMILPVADDKNQSSRWAEAIALEAANTGGGPLVTGACCVWTMKSYESPYLSIHRKHLNEGAQFLAEQ